MTDYHRVQTTREVWYAIRATHGDALVVFGSYGAPDGDHFGNPERGVMQTSYCFRDGIAPIIEARTSWQIVKDERGQPMPVREDEQHEYWLCYAKDAQ